MITDFAITILISDEKLNIAERYARCQPTPEKKNEVRRNVIAVLTVHDVLRMKGIDTNIKTSNVWKPFVCLTENTANLEVPGVGFIECRPVRKDETTCYIPAETWKDRAFYIPVRISDPLKEATILGCFSEVAIGATEYVSLDKLQPIEAKLEQRIPEEHQPLVNLKQWFKGVFQESWQEIETLLGVQQNDFAFNFRTHLVVERGKLIDLGMQLKDKKVALLVAITQNEAEQEVSTRVGLLSFEGENYLPQDLKLALLSDSGETLQEVKSRKQDNYIQLKEFEVPTGESFKIQVSLGEVWVTEEFFTVEDDCE